MQKLLASLQRQIKSVATEKQEVLEAKKWSKRSHVKIGQKLIVNDQFLIIFAKICNFCKKSFFGRLVDRSKILSNF